MHTTSMEDLEGSSADQSCFLLPAIRDSLTTELGLQNRSLKSFSTAYSFHNHYKESLCMIFSHHLCHVIAIESSHVLKFVQVEKLSSSCFYRKHPIIFLLSTLVTLLTLDWAVNLMEFYDSVQTIFNLDCELEMLVRFDAETGTLRVREIQTA